MRIFLLQTGLLSKARRFSPPPFPHSSTRFHRLFCVGVIDAESKKIYCAPQIEPESLETERFGSGIVNVKPLTRSRRGTGKSKDFAVQPRCRKRFTAIVTRGWLARL